MSDRIQFAVEAIAVAQDCFAMAFFQRVHQPDDRLKPLAQREALRSYRVYLKKIAGKMETYACTKNTTDNHRSRGATLPDTSPETAARNGQIRPLEFIDDAPPEPDYLEDPEGEPESEPEGI